MDYAELVAEVSERLGEPGFAMRAAQFTDQAEVELAQHFLPLEYDYITPIQTATTNWLLSGHSEIYIAALIKQFHLFKQDLEKAQAADSYLARLIRDKKAADRAIRYDRERYTVQAPTP